MNDQLLFGTAVVPAIVGLVQVAEDSGLPVRFGPLLSVLLGAIAGLAGALTQPLVTPAEIATGLLTGIGLGLAATGLYHGYKIVATDPGVNSVTTPTTAAATPADPQTDGRGQGVPASPPPVSSAPVVTESPYYTSSPQVSSIPVSPTAHVVEVSHVDPAPVPAPAPNPPAPTRVVNLSQVQSADAPHAE